MTANSRTRVILTADATLCAYNSSLHLPIPAVQQISVTYTTMHLAAALRTAGAQHAAVHTGAAYLVWGGMSRPRPRGRGGAAWRRRRAHCKPGGNDQGSCRLSVYGRAMHGMLGGLSLKKGPSSFRLKSSNKQQAQQDSDCLACKTCACLTQVHAGRTGLHGARLPPDSIRPAAERLSNY